MEAEARHAQAAALEQQQRATQEEWRLRDERDMLDRQQVQKEEEEEQRLADQLQQQQEKEQQELSGVEGLEQVNGVVCVAC